MLFFPIICFGADIVDNLKSGRECIMNIMTHPEMGVAAYNKKNIHRAETLNLSKDLNISEIAQVFSCKTEVGKHFIVETLGMPLNAQDRCSVLNQRQKAIRTLVENSELKNEIEQLLEEAKVHESVVMELMSDFFKGKSCPELQWLAQLKEGKYRIYPLCNFFYTNRTGRTLYLAGNLATFLGTAGGMVYTLRKAMVKHWMPSVPSKGKDKIELEDKIRLFGALLFFTGERVWTVGMDYKSAAQKRIKLHSLNRLVTLAERIENLFDIYKLSHQFKMNTYHDQAQQDLFDALKHSRYQPEKLNLFNIAAIHAFLYEVYAKQAYFAETFACIAELDAYNAIATKIIESQQTHNKFCFAKFLDNAQPQISSKQFWNVLVEKAVPSNISETRQIILTGPNAGGKTTAIRALLQNIVLAQTFGVAAAENFEFTLFDVIHSYLNISDDILNGLSLFASELKRAQDLLKSIKALEADKKFFFALDELFTGTVSEDGETCAYEFVKKLATFDRVQFIYATHFQRLKELSNNCEHCINYKVDAPVKGVEGKLVYPFTLSQGASDSRVALTLAQQAGLFE